jgi:hypothetical protein
MGPANAVTVLLGHDPLTAVRGSSAADCYIPLLPLAFGLSCTARRLGASMNEMTARQPRRTRRRIAPATALPRPVSGDAEANESAESRSARRNAAMLHHRAHHVTKDYSHVHRDLITVTVVGLAVIGFIVGMSFVVG